MRYNIQFALTAEQDLREIAFDVLALSKDIRTTLAFVERLRAGINHLADFPYSGEVPKDRFLMYLGLRYVIQDAYLSFYKVDAESNTIHIVAVLNGRTNYIANLRQRLS